MLEKNIFMVDETCIDARALYLLKRIIGKYEEDKEQAIALRDILMAAREIVLSRKDKIHSAYYFETWFDGIETAFTEPDMFLEAVLLKCNNIEKRYPTLFKDLKDDSRTIIKGKFDELLTNEFTEILNLKITDIAETCPISVLKRTVEGKLTAQKIKDKYIKAVSEDKTDDITKDFLDTDTDTTFTIRFMERNSEESYERFLETGTPEQLAVKVKEHVIGQDKAVRFCSRILYEHMMRIVHPDYNLEKNNYLMIGPTGCGKTEIWRQLSRLSPIPIVILDSSSITQQGFSGNDKEDLLMPLLDKYSDIEKGIVVLDEFDKICKPTWTRKNENVNQMIQSQLLKMMEGTALVKREKTMQTQDITFVCAGAFTGLSEMAETGEIRHGFGFGAEDQDNRVYRNVIECLIEFGMIPELAGRICNVIRLNPLKLDDYFAILKHSKDGILEKLIQRYQYCYNVEFSFTEAALLKAAESSYNRKLGARGINNIMTECLQEYLPQRKLKRKKKVLITEDDIMHELQA